MPGGRKRPVSGVRFFAMLKADVGLERVWGFDRAFLRALLTQGLHEVAARARPRVQFRRVRTTCTKRKHPMGAIPTVQEWLREEMSCAQLESHGMLFVSLVVFGGRRVSVGWRGKQVGSRWSQHR